MSTEPDLGTLTRLRDTEDTIASSSADIRGMDVVDIDGAELGKIDGLFFDEHEQKIRLMEIASGGFLGLGQKKIVIPIDAIEEITTTTVRVNQSRDRVADAPLYDPEIVPTTSSLVGTYGYYGFAPFWGTGYTYPQYTDRRP